jgi:MOSC domain-containing protein YiiM
MIQSELRLLSVQVGKPRLMDWQGEAWRSAIYKEAVDGRLYLDSKNLAGDKQANTKHHGGPDKAVCGFPAEHYPFWRQQLGVGDAFVYGAFGENFTLAGMEEDQVCIGDIYAVGEVRVQVSQPRQPCINLARKWDYEALPKQMQRLGHTGYYLRVVQPGEVGAGDALTLLERPHPEITVACVNGAIYRKEGGAERDALLAQLPALSRDCRWIFQRRLLR